jgi:hypothetical protein
MENPSDEIARAVLNIKSQMHAYADGISETCNLHNGDTLGLIWRGLAAQFQDATSMEMDGRAAFWRCRFRLYANAQPEEPQADSDPDLDPGQPGAMVIRGLPAVGNELIALAAQFHGTASLRGLGHEDVARAIRGIRPTLSRRKAAGHEDATMRIEYDTLETFNEQTRKRGWLARVDLVREARK